MPKIKKSYNKSIKFQAAIAMIKGEQTVAEISQKYSAHPSALNRWKKELLEKGPEIFELKKSNDTSQPMADTLQRKIGELTMEIDFLKKACNQLR